MANSELGTKIFAILIQMLTSEGGDSIQKYLEPGEGACGGGYTGGRQRGV